MGSRLFSRAFKCAPPSPDWALPASSASQVTNHSEISRPKAAEVSFVLMVQIQRYSSLFAFMFALHKCHRVDIFVTQHKFYASQDRPG